MHDEQILPPTFTHHAKEKYPLGLLNETNSPYSIKKIRSGYGITLMHILIGNKVKKFIFILFTCAGFNINIAHANIVEVASAELGFKALSGLEFGGKTWNVDFSDTWSGSDISLSASELTDAKIALMNYLSAQNTASSIDLNGGEFGCTGMGRCQWILVGPTITPNSEIHTLGRVNNYYNSSGDNDSVTENVDLSIQSITSIVTSGDTANAMTFAHFTSPVPEPSTNLLFVIGMILIALLRNSAIVTH